MSQLLYLVCQLSGFDSLFFDILKSDSPCADPYLGDTTLEVVRSPAYSSTNREAGIAHTSKTASDSLLTALATIDLESKGATLVAGETHHIGASCTDLTVATINRLPARSRVD